MVVQWLRICAPNAGGPGLIPGQVTRFLMPQLRPDTAKKKKSLTRYQQAKSSNIEIGLYTRIKWDLAKAIQGSLNKQKSINVMHNINRTKKKIFDYSNRCKKAFVNIQNLFMNQSTQQTGNRREFPQPDKVNPWNSTGDTVLTCEKLKASFLRSRRQQGGSLS